MVQTLSQAITHSLTGVWHNQHGSEIDFVVLDDGRLTGSFTLHRADSRGSDQYPLAGFAKEDILTFCVDFGKHNSMTAWVGQFTGPTNCFEAMWHMVADARGHRDQCWRAVSTGSDTFVRGACPESLMISRKPASHPGHRSII